MNCFTMENENGKYAGVTCCDVNRRITDLKRRYKRYLTGKGKWDEAFPVLEKAHTLTIIKKLETIKIVDGTEIEAWGDKMKKEGWSVGKYKQFGTEKKYNKNYYEEHKGKMMKQIDDARKIRRAKAKALKNSSETSSDSEVRNNILKFD